MREIKFRVYDTEKKELSYGFSIQDLASEMCYVVVEAQDRDELVWQQYTGLKDKNGVEIYEGDYVLYPHKSGPFIVGLELSEEKTNWVQCEVKWKTGGLAAYWGHNDCNIVTFNFKQFIVVGNIFEGVDK